MPKDPASKPPMQPPAPSTSAVEDAADEEELLAMPSPSIYDKVYRMAEKFASTAIGQFVIERGDRMLKTVESTAKWSLPQDKDSKLERHLPWIPFIMMIIMLRLVRMWLSVGALMIGNGPVSAHAMVYFIQTRRRKLRAIRVHGLKAIRRREMEAKRSTSGSSMNEGFMFKLRQLMSSAICRPRRHCEPGRPMMVPQRPSKENLNVSQASKRRRDEECTDMNLTCDQMLAKYANENSEDDSDFIPNPEDEMDTSGSSMTSSDDDSLEEDSTHENGEKDTDKSLVEIKEPSSSAGAKTMMPKPLVEIKKEPSSEGHSDTSTPKMNGPQGNGSSMPSKMAAEKKQPPEPAVEVAKKPTDTMQPPTADQMNGHGKEKVSTPGHESAAQMKPRLMPQTSLDSTAAAAPAPASRSEAGNDNNDLPSPTSIHRPVLVYSSSLPSIPSHPAVFAPPMEAVSLDDCLFEAALRTSESSASTLSLNSFESCCTLTSRTSNEEDMFYSPIGSPPDSNVAFKPVPNPNQDVHSTSKSLEISPAESSSNSVMEPSEERDASKKATIAQQQTGPKHSHYHHQNRYRGKNRR